MSGSTPATQPTTPPNLDANRTYTAAEVQDLLTRARFASTEKSVISVADIKLRYQKIGMNLSPHLLSDGSNFSEWSEALTVEVASLFDHSHYFDSPNADASTERASLTATILQFSIHQDLVPLVRGRVGREAFRILKDRFDKTSWTYIISRWMALTSLDSSHEPDRAYNLIISTHRDIEKRLGSITIDLLAAFILHQNSQNHFHEISNALDARLAVNPRLRFTSKDLLELLGRYKSDESHQNLTNAVLALSTTGPIQATKCRPSNTKARAPIPSQDHPIMHKPNWWAHKWLSPANPCLYCFEWGHWLADCPEKKANRAPRPDPRLTNPNC